VSDSLGDVDPSPGGLLVDPGEAQGDVDHTVRVSFSRLEIPPFSAKTLSRFVLVTALSAGVANVLARIFKLKKSQR
jgi:hypothetical protein